MSTDRIAPERLAKLEALLDRQEIIDCLTRVSRAIDRFDKAMFVAAFHDDAVIDSGVVVASPAENYDAAQALHEHGQSGTMHNILNNSCEIDGEVAHSETYWFYAGRNRDETNWIAGGRYIDRFERRNGEWKIAFRSTVIEWSSTIPASYVPMFEGVKDQLNGAPSRSREDLSYRRPFVNKRPLQMVADPLTLSRPLDAPAT